MKKIRALCLLLSLFCILGGLCGCGQPEEPPVTLGDSMAIPADGIVSAEIFAELKRENRAVVFEGSSAGISYSWTVFGGDIDEEKDRNLALEITEATEERLSFRFRAEENFGFSPMLSIYLNDRWDAQSAAAVTDGMSEQPVSIVTEGQSVLHFAPAVQTGSVVITPDARESDGSGESLTCTISIECSSIFGRLDDLAPGKLEILPPSGVLLAEQTVSISEGESVYDLLQRVCAENGIPMEASFTPMYQSTYVEGISNLYEFDCGSGSGWMYRVDGWYPNYGCSRYPLHGGEKIEWRYTCDLGRDIGGGDAVGE